MSLTASEPEIAPAVLKFFLVEDSLAISENLIATLAEMLDAESLGCARDERTAIEWMRAPDSRCDLMFIDIFLKSGSGLEVLRHAKVLRPEASLVVLTNYATPDMRRRCEQLGADRVFDKSAELDQMLMYCESLASGAV